MLRYKLNINSIKNNVRNINIISYDIQNHYDNDKLIIFFKTDDIELLSKGDNIVIEKKMRLYSSDNFSGDNVIENLYTEKSIVNEVNRINSIFSCLVDKYYKMDVSSVFHKEETNEYVLRFKNLHYFKEDDNARFYIHNTGSLYIERGNYIEFNNCKVISENALSFVDNEGLIDNFTDSEGVITTDIVIDNFITNKYSDIILYKENTFSTISIPFTKSFSTDLYKEDTINNKFVKKEIEKSVNPYVEMEKICYHPMNLYIKKEFIDPEQIEPINNDEYDVEYKTFIKNIVFNIHFRQHRGDNWQCETDSYWNGIKNIINENGEYIHEINEDFFSYKNKSNQSDLMSYADFSDLDIKYQKNKLKKSFLRLSFYDSDNPSKQNLLAYSTIFMNSGKLYNTFIKNLYNKPYIKIKEKYDKDGILNYITEKNLDGIRNDREPDKQFFKESTESEIENMRLSTQFTVGDKYSNESSDGFYLYLWKEDGYEPRDLYLKIDYNNAEYGRTIPLMMPYILESESEETGTVYSNRKGIKTYEEIFDDWVTRNNGYSIKKYMKYSYIKLKCKYDDDSDKFIYYLDPDTYGITLNADSKYDELNTMTLNLYEAKITT